MMAKTIRFTLGALALVMLVPLEALAQAKPPAKPPAAAAAPKAVDTGAETRWNNLFQAAAVLAHEGMEVRRITAAERKQIDDFIAQMKAFITKAKQGGISEAEEDGIDNGIAQLYAMIAKHMSDAQRKAAPATTLAAAAVPKAVDSGAEARWNNLFQAAAVLAHEGMEVRRITAVEKKQIDDVIAQNKAIITKAKQGGISEAEEDGIDNGIAQLYAMIAKHMSDAQRKAAPAATPAAAAPKAVDSGAEARWNNLFQAAAVLAHEGMEVRRITAAEKKQIDDFIAQNKAYITKAKQGGISEAEEDGIDNGIAQLYAMIAKHMSDVQRKAAPAPAKK